MEFPRSLPAGLYLLAYDTRRNRLTARSQLGLVLRAAALAELYLDELVTDDGGRARAARSGPAGDPVLDAVLAEIAGGKPQRWHRLVGRRERQTVRAVRDQLAAARWLRVERRTFLPDRVELRQPYHVKRHADRLRTALREPAAHTDARTAAVLALAANGHVSSVLTRAQRREHRRRLAQLAEPTGPVAAALKKALRAKRAVATGGG
jgi:hypothetical protein